jgi:hypothetical protein
MKKLIFVTIALFNSIDAFATCHKCEVIREENKKKINPYEYYEDYLKDNPQAKGIAPQPVQRTPPDRQANPQPNTSSQ